MLHAVIFDFDGVIADSEPLHLRAYQSVLGADGVTLTREDYYDRYLGFDDEGLFRQLAMDKHIEAGDDTISRWIETKTHAIQQMLAGDSILFPGVAACVRSLAERVPLAIASGALEPEIALVLEASTLRSCFKAIASASDGVRGKPAPDLYLLAIARLQRIAPADPGSIVAIEDSHWGLAAARAAGLRTVAVTHTYPAADLAGADLIVDAMDDVTLASLEALTA